MAEKKESEREKGLSANERTQKNFYARASDVKRALILNQPMILLVYKEAAFLTNQLDPALPSSIMSLMPDYEDVFPKDTTHRLPPIRGIEHQVDFVPGATIPN